MSAAFVRTGGIPFAGTATSAPIPGGRFLPKKGTRSGVLLWATLDADELRQLDAIIKGHNSIIAKVRQRKLRSTPRTQFLGDLIFNALTEKAFPSDAEARPGDVRVKLRLPFGAAEELESWCEAENGRRQRWGGEAIPRQQVIGGLVRRFLHAQKRQQTVQDAAVPEPPEAPAQPAAVLEPGLRHIAWMRSAAWYQDQTNRMLAEELEWRRLAAESWALYDDPWARWFAVHDTCRDALGVFFVRKGGYPNPLQRLGWMRGAARRLVAAGYKR